MIERNKRRQIYEALREAGKAISQYEKSGDYSVETKSDFTPVTDADRCSDSIVRKMLFENFPDLPVLSEEQADKHASSKQPQIFWLLDPLDGTKEFIKGNGEYCISLALINKGRPVEGYIYSPFNRKLWYAIKAKGAYLLENESTFKLPASKPDKDDSLLLLRSRSHHNLEESAWYDKASQMEAIKIEQQGSAIKFCRIAEGGADLYIKKGRIFGWDIAAGDIILSESGGRLIAYGPEQEISYSFSNIEMPFFLACGNRINKPGEWLY